MTVYDVLEKKVAARITNGGTGNITAVTTISPQSWGWSVRLVTAGGSVMVALPENPSMGDAKEGRVYLDGQDKLSFANIPVEGWEEITTDGDGDVADTATGTAP